MSAWRKLSASTFALHVYETLKETSDRLPESSVLFVKKVLYGMVAAGQKAASERGRARAERNAYLSVTWTCVRLKLQVKNLGRCPCTSLEADSCYFQTLVGHRLPASRTFPARRGPQTAPGSPLGAYGTLWENLWPDEANKFKFEFFTP